jgi:hypothetical protein
MPNRTGSLLDRPATRELVDKMLRTMTGDEVLWLSARVHAELVTRQYQPKLQWQRPESHRAVSPLAVTSEAVEKRSAASARKGRPPSSRTMAAALATWFSRPKPAITDPAGQGKAPEGLPSGALRSGSGPGRSR